MTTSPTTSSLPLHRVLRAGVALAIIAAAGCGSDDEKTLGPVEVRAVDRSFLPLYGEVVLFADTDGESRVAITDADGKASGEIEAGGSVWKVRAVGDANMGGTFTAIENVQPGDTVVFGPPARIERPAVATMTFVATPPADGYGVQAVNLCGASYTGSRELRFDDRCGATTDVLFIGYYARDFSPAYYKLVSGQAVVDGGVITVPEGPWNELDSVAITFANLGAMSVSDVAVSNRYGVYSRYTNPGPTPDTTIARLPAVGAEMVVTATIRSEFRAQRVSAVVPTGLAVTLDVSTLLAPFVVQPTAAPFAWSTDAASAGLAADVKVTSYDWTMQVQNVEAVVRVRTISTDVAPGEIGLPQMPDALAQYQPEPAFTVQRSVRLLRFDDGTSADQALDLTEYITEGGGLSLDLFDFEARPGSVAATE